MKPRFFLTTLFAMVLGCAGCGGDSDGGGSAPDQSPDAFGFVAQEDVEPSSLALSELVTISGIDAATPISVSPGGEYAVDEGDFTSVTSELDPGQTVQVRLTASSDFDGVNFVLLTVGDTTAEFQVTTRSADTTPEALGFISAENVPLASEVVSNTVEISGLEARVAIAISGAGEYAINDQEFTDTAGEVGNGDVVRLRGTSSVEYATTTRIQLDIGEGQAFFDIVTEAEPRLSRIEAEASELLGAAMIASDEAGYVENVMGAGSGIVLTAPSRAASLTMRYFSAEDGEISIEVDGQNFAAFMFQGSGEDRTQEDDWRLVAVNKSIPAGARVDIVADGLEAEVLIDYLELSPERIGSITTLFETTGHVDGMNVTPEDTILLGGSYPIREYTLEGEKTEWPASAFASGNPLGMDFDSEGNLYSTNYWTQGVEQYSVDGSVSTFASIEDIGGPNDLVVTSRDELVLANCSGGNIVRLSSNDLAPTVIDIEPGQFSCAAGITRDDQDTLYVSIWNTGSLYSVDTDNTVSLIRAYENTNINHIAYSDGYLYAPTGNGSVIHKVNSEGETQTIGTSTPVLVDGDIRTANVVWSNSIVTANDGETLYFNDQINNAIFVRRIDYQENVPQSPQVELAEGDVTVTLTLSVPENTPEDAVVYITGDFEEPSPWSGGATMNPDYAFTRNDTGLYTLSLTLPAYTTIQYKLTLGSWSLEETNSDGSRAPNRRLLLVPEQTDFELEVGAWLAIP